MSKAECKKNDEENTLLATRNFSLTRRLSIVSLVAMLITAAALIGLYRADQLNEHEAIAAVQNEQTLTLLTQSQGERINAFLSRGDLSTKRTEVELLRLDSLFASALSKIYARDVLKIKLYNLSGITQYSSFHGEIGGTSAHPDWLESALQGETIHHLELRDVFFGLNGEMHDVDVALTYRPLVFAGKRVGVIEIYNNLTPIFHRLNYNILQIALVIFSVFAGLYAALFLIVRRADRFIKTSQKNIVESEERLVLALAAAGDGEWEWNPKSDEALFSRRWKEMLGYTEEEFPNTGAAWIAHLHPEDKDRVLAVVQEHFSGNQASYVVEFRMRCQDDSWRWMLARGKLVTRDAGGLPLRMIGTHTDIHERKMIEGRLHFSEALLRQAESLAAIGSWQFDVFRNELRWSDETYRIFSTPVGTPLSFENFFNLVHPDDKKMVKSSWQEGLKYGRFQRICHRIVADGETRWVEECAQFELDGQGNAIMGIGSVQDITVRKQLEIACSDAGELLQAIIDTVPVRIFWKDLNLRYLGCNPAFAKDSGEERAEDIIGKNDFQLGWRAQAALYRADDLSVMEGISKLAYDEPQTTPDGNTIWLKTSKVPLRNTQGEIIGMLGIYDNITEQKLVELELKKSECEVRLQKELLNSVLENALDAVVQVDAAGIIIDWNRQAELIFGWERKDVIGQLMHKLIVPERYRERHVKGITDFLATGEGGALNKRIEIYAMHRDGREFPIELTTSPNKTAEGYVFSSFIRDITKRKWAEEALRVAATAFETHEAIVITDADSNIVRVNRAFTEITGYSSEEVQGKNPRIMQSGQHDRAFYVEMWQRVLHTGVWAGEIFDRRKNGDIYPKWMTITAVKNEQQNTTHYVAIFSDITSRKQIEEEIHNLAFYDALTKLPNRRLFLDRFRSSLAISARRNDYGAVLFIDLDRFKALNDTLGHDFGDLMLIEVGERIKSCVREMDTVARFGGDEFVVLIDAFSNDGEDVTNKVALVAEKIRESLAQPYHLKGHEYHSSPSIGICMYHGNEVHMDALLEHADMAMYQAKNSGRNAVRFFDPVMQQDAATHDALENDLHYAIASGQLHLHYQVQVDKDNHPLGAEAFLRWIHPEKGLIMPGQFLAIAEESMLTIDVGRWVLKTACQQLVLWEGADATRDFTLTINISAKHFAQADFVTEVASVVTEYEINPNCLKMELSEKLVLTDTGSTMKKIQVLRELGVRLSMDNFGTVYSSLSFIKELSSDQLKIHQEFVQGIAQGSNDTQLVQTIIDLAKSLELGVFAEGVETEAQRAFLKKHDCNTYQGYLFGKPVAIDEFNKLIAHI